MTARPSPETCNCLAVRKAARHVTQFYDKHLAPVGLRTTQFSILACVDRMGAARIGALACELGMDRTTMSRNLAPLERAGLIVAEVDAGDGRSRIVRLTPDGSRRVAAGRVRWRVAQSCFNETYGADKAHSLRETMAEVIATPLAGSA